MDGNENQMFIIAFLVMAVVVFFWRELLALLLVLFIFFVVYGALSTYSDMTSMAFVL